MTSNLTAVRDDVVNELRATFDRWNSPPSEGLPRGARIMLIAADEIVNYRAAMLAIAEIAEDALQDPNNSDRQTLRRISATIREQIK